MSIRYMEGFETVQMYRDLVARGAVVPGNGPAAYTPNPGPARYAGGKSLVRIINGTNMWVERSVGNIGNGGGLALSFAGHNLPANINSVNYNRFPVRYLQGKYVATAAGANPARLTVTDDFRYWPDAQAITAGSTVMLDVIYDTTRNEYCAAVYPSTNTNQFYVSPTITSTAWTATSGAISGNSNSSLPSRLYQDAATGTLICTSGNRIFVRAAGSSTTWDVAYSYSSAALSGGAAFDGTKWYVVISGAAAILTSSNGGLTWALSGTIANASGMSIAAKPGAVVIARGGPTNPLSVSVDGGLTFTNPVLPNPPASTGMEVAYGNGVFVAMPTQGTDSYVYISSNGLNWTSYPIDKAAGTAGYLSFANGYFFASFGTIVGYSVDGISWQWAESSAYGASTTSYIGLQNAGAAFYHGYGFDSSGVLWYRFPTSKRAFSTTSLGARPRNAWDTLECAITRNSATNYTLTGILNGIPFDSRSLTWDLMTDTGPRSYPANGTGYGAYNGKVAVLPYSGGIMYTLDKGETVTSVAIPGIGACSIILWTGTRFIAFTTTGFYASTTGTSGWALIPGSPSAAVQDADVNGSTIIAVGHAVGAYYRSTDGGQTWTASATWNIGYVYSGIVYLNGTWFAQPTWQSAGLRDGKWSNDDGLTWQTISVNPSYTMGHAKSASAAIFTSNQGVLQVTVPVAGEAPVFENRPSSGPAGLYALGYSGKYFLASTNQTTTIYYSTDGISWSWTTTSAGTNSTYLLGVNGPIIKYGGASFSVNTIIYPELEDIPLSFASNGNAHSAIDDVVVTDFTNPNAGPQGEVRVMLMPSDVDIQADWSKVTEDAPTNAAAATKLPVSLSANSYVEANDVGMKDAYGTSAFTYPSGLRPVAVQVEAFYERVFTNTPVVKLGLQSGANEVQTPEVTITSNLGQNTYVSKIVETNPDDGNAWSRGTINGTQITNEKTG